MAVERQPTLYKPKSKIRLALGLGGGQGKKNTNSHTTADGSSRNPASGAVTVPAPAPPLPTAVSTTASTHLVVTTSTSSTATATSSNIASSSRFITSATTTTTVTNTADLGKSTSTTLSRPDSRSLFTYDTSPSDHLHTHTNTRRDLGFDTISYASISPHSMAFDASSASHPPNPVYSQDYGGFLTPPASDHPSYLSSASDSTEDYYEYDRVNRHLHPGGGNGNGNGNRNGTSAGGWGGGGRGDGNESHRPEVELPRQLLEEEKSNDSVYMVSDQELGARFKFIKEIGMGNWGSVWKAQTRHVNQVIPSAALRALKKVGRASATSEGSAGGVVALKCVHLLKEKEYCASARVAALWGEMKVLRTLRNEPHPSIIAFEAMIVTPHIVIVVMPYLAFLMPVGLPDELSRPWMRQLASAVGYLHGRGITHNDIKPANVMLSHNCVPIIIDFGFAHLWDLDDPEPFVSNMSWGTPEYLDPDRAQGFRHDERHSDIWSLGVTFFEMLTGRTPFEHKPVPKSDSQLREEAKENSGVTDEEQKIYLARTIKGDWLDDWDFDEDLEDMISRMLLPDPNQRTSALETYHHPALITPPHSPAVTPHLVRTLVKFYKENETDPMPVPMPMPHVVQQSLSYSSRGGSKTSKTTLPKKRRDPTKARNTTPLGESIRQHTAKKTTIGNGNGTTVTTTPSPRKGSKLVIKKIRSVEGMRADQDDPTPTKMPKAGQPLRHKDIGNGVVKSNNVNAAKKETSKTTMLNDKNVTLRPSHKDLRAARVDSLASLRTAATAAAGKHDSSFTATAKAEENTSTRSSGISGLSGKENIPIRGLSQRERDARDRDSSLSFRSSIANANANTSTSKEEAVMTTMRSLEGLKGASAKDKKRNVLSVIKRPAPEPPRPASEDMGVGGIKREAEVRRSVGVEKSLVLAELPEVEEEKEKTPEKSFRRSNQFPAQSTQSAQTTEPLHNAIRTLSKATPPQQFGSPPRKRFAKKPAMVDDDDEMYDFNDSVPRLRFPSGVHQGVSPLGDLKERIMSADNGSVSRIRQLSAEMMPVQFTPSTAPAASSADKGNGKDKVPTVDAAIPTAATTAAHTTANSDDTTNPAEPSLTHRRSVEALALDSRLDKISEWVKNVEFIVQEARKAIAEGREMPLPLLSLPNPESLIAAVKSGLSVEQAAAIIVPSQSAPALGPSSVSSSNGMGQDANDTEENENEARRRFGVSPDKAIPAHLRTSSTQVEPSTPPKWMTLAEAEERIKNANAWVDVGGEIKRVNKKERPSVVNVLKMFGAEKEKKERADEADKAEYRSSTPEPNMRIPLKPPAPTLRATPSTPMLRSSLSGLSGTQTTRMATRKSESNLRAFNTMPTNIAFADALRESEPARLRFSDEETHAFLEQEDEDNDTDTIRGSPRRLYERFLDTTPGVVRQGDGWGSLSSGKALAKPSSMISLRERARALLGGDKHDRDSRQIVDLAATTSNVASGVNAANSGSERRNSKQLFGSDRRPATPGAMSVLSVGTAGSAFGHGVKEGKEGKGWGRFKINWKGKKGGDEA